MIKKYKQLIVGILIGTMLGVAGIAYADSSKLISVWVMDNIRFEFDNVEKELPQGYHVLVQDEKTYVPTGFIAQNLGAEIDWNNNTRTIKITSKEIDDNAKLIQENNKVTKEYKKLPAKFITENCIVKINSISIDSEATKIYMEVENIDKYPMKLIQNEAKIIYNKKIYNHKDLSRNILYNEDINWYKDIKEDESIVGVINLPRIPKDAKKITLYLQLIQNDETQEKTDIYADIELD